MRPEPAAPEADDEHEAAVDREVQATPAASEPQSMADGEAGASSAADPERSMSRAARDPVPDREGVPHASPLVRRFARELGVPIEGAAGSGAHGRVLVDDVKQQVRDRFADQAAAGGTAVGGIPAMPPVDHASFGPVEALPLTRIQKVSGPGLHRSWLNVPHVTQHDEADVTELERFRKARRVEAADRGLALSPLLFVMKATVAVLREFPAFRASLAPEGDHLVVKNYYHLGIAVDTEQGLVVPVIRDVDRKGIYELAQEVSDTAERARARKLSPSDLSGACFTISSLGGIGGTAFSPIVNAPEVAILGLSRSRVQPVWDGPSPVDLDQAAGEVETPAPAAGAFRPRLILPFSLSYDHRVIDGAAAVRFTTRLAQVLSDPMQLLL